MNPVDTNSTSRSSWLSKGHQQLPGCDLRITATCLKHSVGIRFKGAVVSAESAPAQRTPQYSASFRSILATGDLTSESFVRVMFSLPWRHDWEKLGALAWCAALEV